MTTRRHPGNPVTAPPTGTQTVTVCQLLHSLQVGGAEVLASRLARQLGRAFRFVFVCLDHLGALGEELRAEGFPVEVLGRRPGLDLRCAWRLAALLRRERVDLIHAHQYTPFCYAAMARRLCHRPAILFTEHGRHFPDYPRRKRMVFNRLLLEQRDRVVAVGAAVRRALVCNEGIPEGRIQVVYNGIDLGRFASAAKARDQVRRELGLTGSDFVLLQVARLDYLKDHATALRTVQRLARQLPQVRLLLVGEGPERASIQAFVDQNNLAGHVRLLGLRSDVARVLQAADVFLLTSISEGIPLTPIEAMAAGLPVVSTHVGGTGEVIADGETGLLAPAGDDAALADHLVRLAGDPPLRATLGRNGFARAWELFSEARMHAAYRELFTEMGGAGE